MTYSNSKVLKTLTLDLCGPIFVMSSAYFLNDGNLLEGVFVCPNFHLDELVFKCLVQTKAILLTTVIFST